MTTPSASLSAESSLSASLPRRILAILSATLVVAIAAHISFRLPFTPVPFTLQPMAVLGVGLALGPGAGAAAMLAYLLEGALGLPVFNPTGPGGLLQLLGPTGGYLFAYPLVALVAGSVSRLLRGRSGSYAAALIGCSLATALLFVVGASWLAFEAHLGARAAWMAGVAPFLPGELIKVLAASGVYGAFARQAQR